MNKELINYFMFEGGYGCINGFEGWRELIPKEAGANRVATLPKYFSSESII